MASKTIIRVALDRLPVTSHNEIEYDENTHVAGIFYNDYAVTYLARGKFKDVTEIIRINKHQVVIIQPI